MVELDLFVLVPIIAAFVGMIVGFISIYSNLKTAKAKTRAALDKSVAEVKADLKDYVTLKLDAMDTKVCSVRDEMRQMHELESRAKDNRLFFTAWIQRIEDRIERLHPQKEGVPEEK